MVKAVPGFLQVPDLWQWVISHAVALFSGLTVCAQEHSIHHKSSTRQQRLHIIMIRRAHPEFLIGMFSNALLACSASNH
eukprot:4965006-Amphidinium_carterae.1